jgi:hypothetical protein
MKRSTRTTRIHQGLGLLAAGLILLLSCPSVRAQQNQNQQNQPRRAFQADSLTLEGVNGVIRSGIQALYSMEPHYKIRPEDSFHRGNRSWARTHEMGHHALAAWALLDAGESYQNPPLYRRINWVLASDSTNTYGRGMRAMMLSELPVRRWSDHVRRDAMWLQGALTNKGNFTGSYQGQQKTGVGDNANGQYGVMGLFGVERSNYTIDTSTWSKIDQYWRTAQDGESGGWMLFHAGGEAGNQRNEYGNRISGPMTAGAVSALMITERMLRGDKLGGVPARGRSPLSDDLVDGIDWLDTNFSLSDPAEALDWYYYMWAVQNVGRATGYRTFNGIDWYREVTSEIMRRQGGDGRWDGPKGELLSTSFALLYLGKADDPVAVNKLRFYDRADQRYTQTGGEIGSVGWARWNNRPHDVWNFVEYISEQYEYSTTWQIVELSMPPYALIESPILYVSSDEPLVLDDHQKKNLRGFIEAGGMLVFNPDGGNKPHLRGAIEDLANELFPGNPLDRIRTDHPIYTIHQELGVKSPMDVVSNGVRPLMVYMVADIGKGLQEQDFVRSESFKTLSNLYLYATGLNPRRARLDNNYVVQVNEQPSIPLRAARIKHGGNYDPESGALKQLKAILANDHDIDLRVDEVSAEELSDHQIAFLTTLGDARLSGGEAQAIRQWVLSGGTLVIDACGGGPQAEQNAREQLLGNIMPNRNPVPLSNQSPLISGRGLNGGHACERVRWRFYALRRMGPVNTPRLQAIHIDQRPAVIYSAEDLTAGLAGLNHWSIFGYRVESARRLMVNIALRASLNQIGMPAGNF